MAELADELVALVLHGPKRGHGRGAGDRTRESWLREHERCFRRYLPTIGREFDPEMPAVFERFQVVYEE